MAPLSSDRKPSRDRALPRLVALSLLAHLAAILFLLGGRQEQAPPPTEIPVEIVQLPKEPPPEQTPAKQARSADAHREKPERQAGRSGATVAQDKTSERKTSERKSSERRPARKLSEPKTPPPGAAGEPVPPKPVSAPASPPMPLRQDVAERFEHLLGPMPAVALPGASELGTEEVSYKQLVLSQVAKAKKEGRYTGIPGVTTVSFSVDDRGGIVRCEVVSKSVDPALDAEALAMIRRGAPYPAPPPGAVRDFVIGLRFQELP